jgi:hypothetical protein
VFSQGLVAKQNPQEKHMSTFIQVLGTQFRVERHFGRPTGEPMAIAKIIVRSEGFHKCPSGATTSLNAT